MHYSNEVDHVGSRHRKRGGDVQKIARACRNSVASNVAYSPKSRFRSLLASSCIIHVYLFMCIYSCAFIHVYLFMPSNRRNGCIVPPPPHSGHAAAAAATPVELRGHSLRRRRLRQNGSGRVTSPGGREATLYSCVRQSAFGFPIIGLFKRSEQRCSAGWVKSC